MKFDSQRGRIFLANVFLCAAVFASVLSAAIPRAALARAAQAASTPGPSELKIGGAVQMPFTISVADLKQMPRQTVKVDNSHDQKTEVYEGVPLAALLRKAGLPQGEQLRGQWMTAYVLVEAADNYRVAFSLAELDSSFLDSDVLVADTLNGAPLAPDQGPLKLVAPHDKRPGRWVKMVKSITVVHPPN